MVSTKKIIQIMDKYKLDKLFLSPQPHNIENGSYDWLINVFPEVDPLKMKLKFDAIYKGQKISSNFNVKNEEIKNVCNLDNNRLKSIYTIDINTNEIINKLNSEYKQSQFSALKINNLFSTIKGNNKNINNVINFCKIKNIPLLLYAYKQKECDYIYSLALEYKDTLFIIASMSGLEFFEYHKDLPGNLLCEVNNLNLVSEYRLLKALYIFGPGQLLFTFEAINEENLKHSINRILNLSIPDLVKKRILNSNIDLIYNSKF